MKAIKIAIIVIAGLMLAGYFVLGDSDSDVEKVSPAPVASAEVNEGNSSSAMRQETNRDGEELSTDIAQVATERSRSNQTAESDQATYQAAAKEVVSGEGVNQGAALQLLTKSGFSHLMEDLRSDDLSSEEIARNQEYKDFVATQEEFASGKLVQNEMECGKSICAVSVQVFDEESWDKFSRDFLDAQNLPNYVVVESKEQVDGVPVRRLMISVDPAVNSLRFSAN